MATHRLEHLRTVVISATGNSAGKRSKNGYDRLYADTFSTARGIRSSIIHLPFLVLGVGDCDKYTANFLATAPQGLKCEALELLKFLWTRIHSRMCNLERGGCGAEPANNLQSYLILDRQYEHKYG